MCLNKIKCWNFLSFWLGGITDVGVFSNWSLFASQGYNYIFCRSLIFATHTLENQMSEIISRNEKFWIGAFKIVRLLQSITRPLCTVLEGLRSGLQKHVLHVSLL
jgi:hypothetical protein